MEKLLHDLELISTRINTCNKLVDELKTKINDYFSDKLQRDRTAEGKKKKLKLKNELLAFANK